MIKEGAEGSSGNGKRVEVLGYKPVSIDEGRSSAGSGILKHLVVREMAGVATKYLDKSNRQLPSSPCSGLVVVADFGGVMQGYAQAFAIIASSWRHTSHSGWDAGKLCIYKSRGVAQGVRNQMKLPVFMLHSVALLSIQVKPTSWGSQGGVSLCGLWER
jgi:hypothetical protein